MYFATTLAVFIEPIKFPAALALTQIHPAIGILYQEPTIPKQLAIVEVVVLMLAKQNVTETFYVLSFHRTHYKAK